MKNMNDMNLACAEKEYEAPALYMLEACSEGVLCASVTNEGFIRELNF